MPIPRVRRSAFIAKWLVFVGVIALGIWWTRWLLKAEGVIKEPAVVRAAQVQIAPEVPVAEAPQKPKVRTPERRDPASATEEARSEPKADPSRDEHDYQPAPVRPEAGEAVSSQGPKLGIETDAPSSGKPWIEPQDATYVGKVIACDGPKYDQSRVMGAIDGQGLNSFYLCLDVGTAFTKVQVDNLYNPVFFSYKGNDYYRVALLRKNDVIRVRVNDGQALKVEMVKSVND